MFNVALSEVTTVAASSAISVAISAAAFAIGRIALAFRKVRQSRQLADKDAFESALATADLKMLGAMLRDRFGSVSVETLLDDSRTQEQVFRSLKRLTEVVNQPAPDEGLAEAPLNAGANTKTNEENYRVKLNSSANADDFVDLLEPAIRKELGAKICVVAKAGNNQVHGTDLWTALARARRELEREILPLMSGGQKFLSPRSFLDPRLRTAFGVFLGTANRAIHGEDITLERAERAMDALHFVGSSLQTELPAEGSLVPDPPI